MCNNSIINNNIIIMKTNIIIDNDINMAKRNGNM